MPRQAKHKLEEHRTLTLQDGSVFQVRSIQPFDVPALQRFHSRCSAESIRLRFFFPMKGLSAMQARYFADIDSVDHFALVALDPYEPDEIIAVVRFVRVPGSNRAEYAAIVEDRWQGRGLGTVLTQQLIEAALDRGIEHFYALVMPGNGRMLRLLRSLELPEHERREGSNKYVEVELQELAA